MLRRQNAIEVRTLVEIRIARVGLPAEQRARELEHVVGDARLLRLRSDGRRELPRVSLPLFVVRRPAGGVRAQPGHGVPEERRDRARPVLSRALVPTRHPEHLRDRRVRVNALELVATHRHRRQHLLVIEPVRERRPLRVVRHTRELVEDVVHPTIFDAEHALPLLIRHGPRIVAHPERHSLHHLERLRIGRERPAVEQPGHDLVVRVERGPHALARLEAIEQLGRKRAQVPGTVLLLARRELGDHRGAPIAHRCVTRLRKRERTRGEVMPGEVPAELVHRRLPPA